MAKGSASSAATWFSDSRRDRERETTPYLPLAHPSSSSLSTPTTSSSSNPPTPTAHPNADAMSSSSYSSSSNSDSNLASARSYGGDTLVSSSGPNSHRTSPTSSSSSFLLPLANQAGPAGPPNGSHPGQASNGLAGGGGSSGIFGGGGGGASGHSASTSSGGGGGGVFPGASIASSAVAAAIAAGTQGLGLAQRQRHTHRHRESESSSSESTLVTPSPGLPATSPAGAAMHHSAGGASSNGHHNGSSRARTPWSNAAGYNAGNGSLKQHAYSSSNTYYASSNASSSSHASSSGGAAAAWAEKGNELFKEGAAALSTVREQMVNPWTLVRKLLSITLQGAILFGVLAFAVYGGYMFITMRWSGRYMRIPVYTKYEIGQAGWQRPLLAPSLGLADADADRDPLAASTPAAQAGTTHPAKVSGAGTVKQEHLANRGTELQLYNFDQKSARADGRREINDLHVLILTPLKNAVDVLDNFFELLTGLEHPKENTSIGFLIGDEEDHTGKLVDEWVQKQHDKGEYRKISLLKKDFGIITPGGDARHKNWLQAQRRSLMAKARTLLLTSTLEPSVDWVLWLDSDLSECPKSLIADLLFYGHAGVYPDNYDNTNTNPEEYMPLADVITPNIMRRLGPGQIQGYDLNNWAETPQSLKMKAKLPNDRILHEGQQNRPTHRALLARSWVPPNITSTWNDNSPYFPYMPEIEGPTDLYDPESDAYIGRTMELDGVGGVATLVRAETHRFGAVFPSWVQDHQVETEGFGVMARQTGARIVGLQNYLVYHYFAEYGMLGI